MLLRPHSLSYRRFLLPPYASPELLSQTATPSLFCSSATAVSTAAATAIQTSGSNISYGPSLRKGTLSSQTTHPLNPPSNSTSLRDSQIHPEEREEILFKEDQFTRAYKIAALRVPSEHCYALESRLRGHLLNWPRIRNVARVPGDEVDEEVQNILTIKNSVNDEAEILKALCRRIDGKAEGDGEELSPVLYRDKLVKEFNARGFVSFRNLARISRPKRKKKKMDEIEQKGEMSRKRRQRMVVEVVEVGGCEGGCVEEGEDFCGLLGDKFRGRKWRGSTRLLLLDERYAEKEVDELPEAVKAVLRGGTSEAAMLTLELVSCLLTLYYDYWPMNEVLEALLPMGMIIPSAFETVGHIAHLNLSNEHLPYKKLIAKVVLDKNKPKIRTVVNKIDAITGDYRTMQLEVLAGNHSLVTMVVENGLRFHVDLATVYWNSRLATERQRLVSCFTQDDVVCDVFSGVGPIAIAAAKKVKHVYANDLNPYAVDYLQRNCVLNKVERKIEVFNMDGRRFIDAMFSTEKGRSITQVVMNLPNDAAEYLDAFRGLFRNKPNDKACTLPAIHVYGFSKAEDPEFDFHERIRIALLEAAVAVDIRRVRLVAPGKWMLCASFALPKSVAFARSL
ncbi:hypothetical protein Nepgr_007513 [Nepenthes gracilis]|uniref:tRNA (guanine(37)-N1)-methyltransferase n=1 Tax=Nepenthes gracilis TaxID=150966 RepID=A0AAD3S722_NEPGR|nr:hypothetical protein Nepgr_007513 [Nepenthes gracilis]